MKFKVGDIVIDGRNMILEVVKTDYNGQKDSYTLKVRYVPKDHHHNNTEFAYEVGEEFGSTGTIDKGWCKLYTGKIPE